VSSVHEKSRLHLYVTIVCVTFPESIGKSLEARERAI
jgi:hypothetical protein